MSRKFQITLPDDMAAIADAFVAIHQLPVPPPEARAPLQSHNEPIAATLRVIEEQAAQGKPLPGRSETDLLQTLQRLGVGSFAHDVAHIVPSRGRVEEKFHRKLVTLAHEVFAVEFTDQVIVAHLVVDVVDPIAVTCMELL